MLYQSINTFEFYVQLQQYSQIGFRERLSLFNASIMHHEVQITKFHSI